MIRISRLCPGCAQRKLQMNDAPCEICGRENLISSLKARDTTHPAAQMLRLLLRAPGWKTHAFLGVACACALWLMTRNWVVPFPDFVPLLLLFTATLAAGSCVSRALTRVSVWVFSPATRGVKRENGWRFLVLPLVLLGMLGLQLAHLPLRVGFWLSRGALMQTVGPARQWGFGAGPFPSRAGIYRIGYPNICSTTTMLPVADNRPLSTTQAGFAHCGGNSFSTYENCADWKLIWLSREWVWWEKPE